jgi:hypothetical protein
MSGYRPKLGSGWQRNRFGDAAELLMRRGYFTWIEQRGMTKRSHTSLLLRDLVRDIGSISHRDTLPSIVFHCYPLTRQDISC